MSSLAVAFQSRINAMPSMQSSASLLVFVESETITDEQWLHSSCVMRYNIIIQREWGAASRETQYLVYNSALLHDLV